MKTRETDVLYDNVTITHQVPASYEEGDRAVGEIGGVLHGFIADNVARNLLPRLYRAVSRKLVEQGFPKETKKEGENTITETDIKHCARVYDDNKAMKPVIEELLQTTANEIPFHEKTERATGFGRIAVGAQNGANNYFAQGAEAVERAVTAIETLVSGYKIQRDSNGVVLPEGLARGIMAVNKKISDDAKRQANALLGL